MLFMGKLERGGEATNRRRHNLVLAASSLPSFFQAPLVPAKRGEGGGGKQQLFLATPFNSTAEGGGRRNGGGEVQARCGVWKTLDSGKGEIEMERSVAPPEE